MRQDDGTILLVDDNPRDVELTLRALRKNGIHNRVVVARGGAEALDFLLGGDRRAAPDLVLLDLNMPGVDGLEVLRRLRADEGTQLLPVVILTSSGEDADRLAGYRSGANSYVCKPVDFLEFSEAVRQVGAYWLILNKPPPAAPGSFRSRP